MRKFFLYKGVITSVWAESGLSQEFFVKVSVHQGTVLSPLLFAIVADAKEGLMDKILYVGDLVLASETLEDLQEKILKWKMTFKRNEG